MTDYTAEREEREEREPFDGRFENASEPLGSLSRRTMLGRVAGAGAAFGLLSAGSGAVAARGSNNNGSDSGSGNGGSGSDMGSSMSDVDVLNYALTLEHLEATYYNDFLDEYTEHDVERSDAAKVFADPGSRYSTYQKIQTVRDHEEAHVEALTKTIKDLGGTPVEPAEYEFPYDSVEAFAELSATIEAVGVSAYAGAAPLIESDDVLAAALSIHSVEARHTAYFNVLNTTSPFPNAFDPARTMDEVLEIASQFIVGMDGGGEGKLSVSALQASTGQEENPKDEFIEYRNTGDGTLDLTGWTVSNDRGTTYQFPDGFTLAPGDTVRLYTGSGTDTRDALYWGKSAEVWNDRIDTMTVRDANGDVALQQSYGS